MENINELKSFNVILSSDSCKNLFPNNKPYEFSVLLSENLPEYDLEVAVTDIILPTISNIKDDEVVEVFITSNICQPIYVNENLRKVLRLIYCDKNGNVLNKFYQLLFIPLRMNDIDTITIKLVDKKFNVLSEITSGTTIISLLFRRRE